MQYFKKILVLVLLVLFASTSFAAEKITIASWNIQNFGKSKAEDDSKMAIIADMLSKYDIIAVQEISNIYEKSDEGCPRNENACPGNKNCDLIQNALKNTFHRKAIKTMPLSLVLRPKTNGISLFMTKRR